MSKKQGNKITKSIQFDFEYNKNEIEPFLKETGMSFSFFARQAVIKEIANKKKDNEK